ncbi:MULTISPECIES: hypothetical protein [Brevibacillus]|uniref:hypothetical protein n=1 Tax=Brevibacillus TaxID=55080 RepID=UPI00245614D4|nr:MULTISPECIES: hypothetical protein [Brevibacillus]MDH4618082.1 hypothetical protein [Brevibacillus sp. AY1]MED1951836.1 hypothetical protein [Brevibacillus centrosporus]
MIKTFFFEVEWNDALEIKKELNKLWIPYTVEQNGSKVIFALPDLPVRQYGKVREFFGSSVLEHNQKEAD